MWARIALAAVAIGVIAVAGVRLHDSRTCESAGVHAFALGEEHLHPGLRLALEAPGRVAGQLLDSCHDPAAIAQAATAMLVAGQVGDAERLARAAVRRSPRDFNSWVALDLVLTRQHRSTAAARARIRALNPLSISPG